jgi:hypothetical protein
MRSIAAHANRPQSATIPRSAFADPSPCSVRISYGALDSDSVIEGLRRLVGGLQALAG